MEILQFKDVHQSQPKHTREVIVSVSYADFENELQMEKVEPYIIRSVCDFLDPYETSIQEFEEN